VFNDWSGIVKFMKALSILPTLLCCALVCSHTYCQETSHSFPSYANNSEPSSENYCYGTTLRITAGQAEDNISVSTSRCSSKYE
jgi:hypothetical protein